jgi:hypothetical protein
LSRYERFSLIIERARDGGYIVLDYEVVSDLKRPIFAGDMKQVQTFVADRMLEEEAREHAPRPGRR